MSIDVLNDPNTLKKVQNVQLEILKEFDRICRKNNITYQLWAGTLLGAIRHEGFIPWDDDIDVAMLRSDYEKFISICNKELDDKYFIQTFKTDPNSQSLFAKIKKNGTIYRENRVKNTEMHHGIFIDIFPLDNVKDNKKYYTIKLKIASFLYRIHIGLATAYDDASNAKKKIKSVLNKLINNKIKFKLKNIIEKLITYENKNDSNYINHLTNGINIERLDKFLVKKDTFNNVIEKSFEGEKFFVPENYDDLLKNIYGNYMELPPIDQQTPHHGIVEVKFKE